MMKNFYVLRAEQQLPDPHTYPGLAIAKRVWTALRSGSRADTLVFIKRRGAWEHYQGGREAAAIPKARTLLPNPGRWSGSEIEVQVSKAEVLPAEEWQGERLLNEADTYAVRFYKVPYQNHSRERVWRLKSVDGKAV